MFMESQTPSFLLTVHISCGYDRLLSSSAIVKRFQTKKSSTPPEWQATFPLVFRNHYVLLEN